ncbi:MAG: VCBS repeat-containing protein [Gemmatimonadota bacterium]|nr:MAG: VCBS repeat-containing protein [Gemmatimonadota bacterium]
MKRIILVLTFFACVSQFSHAQTFTEVTEGGWGQGINDSKPFFTDLDNDGLLDLIIGEYDGSLHHYEQDAGQSISFTLISRFFNSIDVGIFAAPTITDLESDGLVDLLIGEQDGNLNHYEQVAANSDSFALVTDTFNDIDVGDKSVPFCVDVDRDGMLDLIISSQNGTLFRYEQDAFGSTAFTLVSDNFSDISAGFFGTVCFTDLDHDGLFDMFTGRNPGYLNHYEQDSSGSSGFSLVSSHFNDIDNGGNSTPTFTDLDGDGFLDLIVGGMHGNLYHYGQDEIEPATFSLLSENLLGIFDVEYDAAPCFIDLDEDGLMNMIIGTYWGTLHHYEQDGVNSETFLLVTESFCDIDVGRSPTPAFTDLDNDGLLDLIIGERDGDLHYYEQETEGSINFTLISDSLSGIDVGSNAAPAFADLDQDGFLDMLVGENDGNVNHYEQDAVGSTTFNLISEHFNEISVTSYAAPHFTDFDDDGLFDLIVGQNSHSLHHYEQETAGSALFTLISDRFVDIMRGVELKPACIDIDGDGDQDLFVGDGKGGLHFWRNMEPGGAVRGDCNGDGSINLLDILRAVQHILGTSELQGDDLWAADCNGDGDIDLLDLLGIVNVILGLGECAP